MPTREELKMLQSLPLDIKIMKTQQRIRDWVNYYGTDGVYVSFSGGKDSTVLLHLVRELYPNIEAVFVNTGLEYPEIQKFVKSFDNVTVLRPKMSFVEVITKYGYPFISKDVSQTIYFARKNIQENKYDTVRVKKLFGEITLINNGISRYNYEKYKPLLEVDFVIGDKCCNVMKKAPIKKLGKKPIIGTLADESLLRMTDWLKHGCNSFDGNQTCKPLSFWTEQDILHYIKQNNIPIASVYGDIVVANRGAIYDDTLCDCGGKLCTTGCSRTGCIFCGFGVHMERGESRFQRLKRTHPRQYEYCMGGGAYDSTDGLWKPTKDGLGMAHCIDEINKIYGKDFIKYE